MLDFLKKNIFCFFPPFLVLMEKTIYRLPCFTIWSEKLMNMYLKVVFVQWEKKESETLTDIYCK